MQPIPPLESMTAGAPIPHLSSEAKRIRGGQDKRNGKTQGVRGEGVIRGIWEIVLPTGGIYWTVGVALQDDAELLSVA